MADNILIIGADSGLRAELISSLKEANFEVMIFPDHFEGLSKLNEFKPDLVILDVELPVGDGWETCFKLRHAYGIPVILLGKERGGEVWERAVKKGADFYFTKPLYYPEELAARVKAILKRYKLQGK